MFRETQLVEKKMSTLISEGLPSQPDLPVLLLAEHCPVLAIGEYCPEQYPGPFQGTGGSEAPQHFSTGPHCSFFVLIL